MRNQIKVESWPLVLLAGFEKLCDFFVRLHGFELWDVRNEFSVGHQYELDSLSVVYHLSVKLFLKSN